MSRYLTLSYRRLSTPMPFLSCSSFYSLFSHKNRLSVLWNQHKTWPTQYRYRLFSTQRPLGNDNFIDFEIKATQVVIALLTTSRRGPITHLLVTFRKTKTQFHFALKMIIKAGIIVSQMCVSRKSINIVVNLMCGW